MATAIYSNLITEIKNILNNCSTVQQVFAYPEQKFGSIYPTVVFFPSEFENDFESTKENMEIKGFKMWIICGAKNTTMSHLFENVLPATVDDVLAEFNKNWELNSIDGQPVWIKIDSGEWGVSNDGTSGREVYAEFDINIKLITNN